MYTVKTLVCDETVHNSVVLLFQRCSLTLSDGVVDPEAAQHLIDIAGVEESISSHHHLEGLWLHDTH